MTCKEVAQRYGVKTATVWAWIRSGKLTAVQIGRIYRVRPEDLERFDKSNMPT